MNIYLNQDKSNSKSKSMRCNFSIFSLLLVTSIIICMFFVQTVVAQTVLVQTGFEEFDLGAAPTDWAVRGSQIVVSADTVKNGEKALGILGANDDNVGVAIETENPIISVEFWAYVKGAGRSFNFKVVTNDAVGVNDGGVYLNWNANATRLYDGSAWVTVGDFPFETWKYVRVVADVTNSVFDYYVGDDREAVLLADPISGLAFRKAAENPTAQWVSFHVYSTVAQGFVDDLLVYEGGDPPSLTPVDPKGKLATFWGQVKKQSSFR